MNALSKLILLGMAWLSAAVVAQTITYSPYTPAQLKAFNSQPAALPESPLGPIDPSPQGRYVDPSSATDAGYVSQPVGEEEAESLQTDSSTPYDPIKPVFTF